MYEVQFQMFSQQNSLKCLFDQMELNMRQRRWIDFLNYYDFELKYHYGKENLVAYALSMNTLNKDKLLVYEVELYEKF